MANLIDKDALVLEIRKRLLPVIRDKHYDEWEEGQDSERQTILDIINALEVKEVDLEKALSDLDKDIKEFVTTEEFENESATPGHYWAIAKHAFLLGLKAQKWVGNL